MRDCVERAAAVKLAAQAKKIYPYSKEPGKPETYSEYNEGWSDCAEYMEGSLKGAPAAVAVIVEPMEWVPTFIGINTMTARCSHCESRVTFPIVAPFQACPYCFGRVVKP